MGAPLTPAKFIKGVFSILQEHMTLHIQWLVLSHSIEPAVLIKNVKSQDSCMITGLNPWGWYPEKVFQIKEVTKEEGRRFAKE